MLFGLTFVVHQQIFSVRALYLFFICLYYGVARIISLWNKKASLWINGRKNTFARLKNDIHPNDKIIWIHCSSAGEFEQGKPIIEGLKREYPGHKILVSLYSPSGFSVADNYTFADITCYLPLDTPGNANEFLNIVHPSLVIFVKYDYWYFHLNEIKRRNIPLLLVSAVFREDQPFFKWYGSFFRKLLHLFSWIFVQNEASLSLLRENEYNQSSIAGDTRFDRVNRITENDEELPGITEFINNHPCLVAGSTWEDDETFLSKVTEQNLKIIIAPHVITPAHINEIKNIFPEAATYSSLPANNNSQILIIDNVGMLSRLYRYATIAYVGGGFTRDGVHNVLEPAVYGKPVIYGNNYQKYREAIELIESGGAFTYTNNEELSSLISKLLKDQSLIEKAGFASKKYVEDNTGATQKIIDWIYANRLLTN